MSFQDMIRGQIIRAALIGGVIVLFLVAVGLAFGILLLPGVLAPDYLLVFVLIMLAFGFIAGFITVYLIMSMAIKRLMAMFMPAPKPEKPEKKK